jgi:hypothetical protein
MNEHLRVLYEAAFPTFGEIAAGSEKVSWPLLLEVPEGYSSVPVKLLVVGQETRGWGSGVPRDVEEVVALYRAFELGRWYRATPFWQAVHRLHRLLNPDAPPRAFLWSNLVKVSQHKTRPSPVVEEAVCRLGLLRAEIRITRPDAIVFFTGSSYDGRLRETFPGAALDRLSRFVSRVRHEELPWHSYRTSHPNYLRLSGNWQVLEEIASQVAGGREPAEPGRCT